jgi:phosphatidate cytidylyltransferase
MARVLSGVVLAALLLFVVCFLPPNATLLVAVLASAVAFAEYADLAAAVGARIPIVASGAAVAAACVAVGGEDLPLEPVCLAALICVGVLAIAGGQPGPEVLRDAAASLFPVLYIGIPLGTLAAIRSIGGRDAILLLIVTIIVSDSAQYYTGRAFGRRPLAPAISPSKTIEGAVGGLVLGTAAMTLGGLWVFKGVNLWLLVPTSVAVVALGMIGDLFESLLKRSAGVKDSSTLIPGHGGMLDRIDSWLFAGPVFYVFTRYLQAS